ncbi:MAG: amino acid permease [Candidatus Latescibacteria bacterium]|jgi:basic amino acid/polyamine antiporter, APA family|nr:amino acid permease [Candidatus Latescibacterota bacterium]
MNSADGNNDVGLIRQLGLFDTTMVVTGIVIGSGIFLTTGIMAEDIPSASLIMLAWLLGGLHALAGALTYAELGASIPEAGGQYVYLREAYGRFAGYIFGWISFIAYLTGIIAGLAVGFAETFGYFYPALGTGNALLQVDIPLGGWTYHYVLSAGQLLAVAMIVIISGFNYMGVVFGKIIQNISTVIKVGAILVFIILGLSIGPGEPIDWSLNPEGLDLSRMVMGFGIALVAVAWATAGWEEVSFIAGEIKDPSRNIPRALVIGTATITVLYLLMNFIYLRAMPIEQMRGVIRIGEITSNLLFGELGASLLAAAVAISILGSINGTVLVGPRVYYAMARDNLFFKNVAKVHPRFHTPGPAIILQAAWAIVLTLSGTFEDLIIFVTFANLILWIAGAAAVFTLRKKRPDLPRPYKTWGFPFVPIFFIVVSACVLVNSLWEAPGQSLAGLGLILLGVPIYWVWRKEN